VTRVRRLDPILVDRIAAGEVVERPAAAVKELVENAVDAGAGTVEITIEAGGRRLIRVVDDGRGMSPEDLELAVDRHATSKLPDGDLFQIATLGFRGEALPSIGPWRGLRSPRAAERPRHGLLDPDRGRASRVRAARSAPRGTRVEVTDLFAATPARLKFLKSDRSEAQAVAEIVKRLAIAHPTIASPVASDHLTPSPIAEAPRAAGFLRRSARVPGPRVTTTRGRSGEREGSRVGLRGASPPSTAAPRP
jgi:DNA mismatch repair protein MutL